MMKFLFEKLVVIFITLLLFPITTVLADDKFSKVEGVLTENKDSSSTEKKNNSSAKTTQNVNLSSNKQSDIQQIPHLGDNQDKISTEAGLLLIVIGIFLGVKKKQGMKNVLLVFGIIIISSYYRNTVYASEFSSVQGEIIAGDFLIEQPENVRFKAKITDQYQRMILEDIHTNVKDYRGINEGWIVSLKSQDYQTYKGNFSLIINGKIITDEESIIIEKDKQSMTEELRLKNIVEISATAVAGSYIANLEWNLQPNTNKLMNE